MFEVFSVAYILNIWGLFYSQLCYFLHLWCFVSTQSSVRNFSQQCAHIFIEFLSLSIGTVPYRVNVSQNLVFNGIVLVF